MGEHAVTGRIVKVGWASQLLRVAAGFPPVRKLFRVNCRVAQGPAQVEPCADTCLRKCASVPSMWPGIAADWHGPARPGLALLP